MNIVAVHQNGHEWHIRGQVDLASDASVGANRGTNEVWTKTGTGTYKVVIKGTGALKMYEILDARANLMGASPATVFTARVTTITQATDGTDDITVNITTLTNAATPAAGDTSAAITLTFEVVLRVANPKNPFV